MRVTNNMLTSNLLWNVNQNLNSMNIYQKQLASGKRVHAPSDDPIGVTKIIKYKSDIAQNSQYKTNTRDAIAWMEITENSLMDSKDIMQRIRELTVQGANGTLTAQETSQIAKEVDQLREELVKIGNASIAGKYVFSGFNTNEPLFKDNGDFNLNFTSQKVNDFEFIEYETGAGTTMVVNTHPLSIYGYVPEDNYMTQNMPVGSSEGTSGTRGKLVGDFDLSANHTTNDYDVVIDVDGPGGTAAMTFNIDNSVLDGSGTPLSKSLVIDTIKNADDGSGNKLGTYAEVYYDENDDLVIKNKLYGATSTIAITGGSAGDYNPTLTAGVDGAQASVTADSAAAAFPDPIPAGQETASFVVKYNGVEKRFDLDMTSYTGAPTGTPAAKQAEMIADVNSKMDAEFGVGNVVLSLDAGKMKFATKVSTDGTPAELEVDYIAAKQSSLIEDLEQLSVDLKANNQVGIDEALGKIDVYIDKFVTNIADVGARTNRLEFIDNRISDNELSLTKLLSEVQDVDVSKTIIMMKALENVYRASLSVGSKVIQPTLVDFIR